MTNYLVLTGPAAKQGSRGASYADTQVLQGVLAAWLCNNVAGKVRRANRYHKLLYVNYRFVFFIKPNGMHTSPSRHKKIVNTRWYICLAEALSICFAPWATLIEM